MRFRTRKPVEREAFGRGGPIGETRKVNWKVSFTWQGCFSMCISTNLKARWNVMKTGEKTKQLENRELQ
jgi:hypothetical protein